MANTSFKVKKSLNIESGGTGDASGDITVNSNKLEFHNGTTASPVVTEAHSQSLTNKTIDADQNTVSNIEDADIKAAAGITRSKLASGTASHVLVNDGSGVMSSEAQLAVSRGGTGQSTASGAFDAISPTTTRGDIIARGASSNSRLAVGGASTALLSDGTDPAWGQIADAHVATGAAIARSKVASGTASHVVINDGSGNLSSEASLAISRGGTGQATQTAAFDALAPTTTKGDIIVSNGSDNIRLAVGSDSQVLTADSAQASGVKWATPSSAPTQPYELSGLGLACSVAASALTVALKQSDGSTDPSAGSPVKIGFRSSTATSGAYNTRQVTGALSVVVSSGSTLGTTSGNNHYLYVYALDNAGTVELAISGTLYDDGSIQSTSAEGGAGGADTLAAIYSTTARSNVPVRCVARLKSNQATAGTWASAPTEVSLAPFSIADYLVPTAQTFTSGSGTYTTPTSPRIPRFLRVRMVGGGGGGGGMNTAGTATSGGNGGASTFGSTLSAGGGNAGVANNGSATGGAGGSCSASFGTALATLTGGTGGPACQTLAHGGGPSSGYIIGGNGGNSYFGGGGSGGAAANNGQAGVTNTGGGGGGAGTTNNSAVNSGSGGGSGGYVEVIVTSPANSYSYSVGAGGTAGTKNGGTGYDGGAGGSGYIIVEEHYQ